MDYFKEMGAIIAKRCLSQVVLMPLAVLCFGVSVSVVAKTLTIPDSAIRLHETVYVGKPIYLESKSPSAAFSVVFEEDGKVAYLYGLSLGEQGGSILDMLHIYDVGNVREQNLVSDLKIVWSADGDKALLLLNDFPHAAFDFAGKRGYCRNNYPPPNADWTDFSHEWQDEVLKLFM